jgi:hypothetical protein
MENYYYKKYLKYKAKYLELKQQVGGGFQDVWKDIKLTDEHLIELFGSKENATGKDTIDGVVAAFDKMNEVDGSENKTFPFGVKNKAVQPKWYVDNPMFFTIRMNNEYYEAFNEALNTIEKESSTQTGGTIINRNKRKPKEGESILKITNRVFGTVLFVTAVIAASPLLVTYNIVKSVDGKCTEQMKKKHQNYC